MRHYSFSLRKLTRPFIIQYLREKAKKKKYVDVVAVSKNKNQINHENVIA
jgi:hypothetical protein